MVLWFHTITILTVVMTVNVIRYHNLDHDDDSDCDPEESFESKEGGLLVGRTTSPVPIDCQSHLIHRTDIIFIIFVAVTVMMTMMIIVI